MDTCLLCLKTASSFNTYIPFNSEKWWQSDIPGIIEKHFWPVDNQPNTLGICFLCWSKLHEFHIFYQNIEEAHRKLTGTSREKKFINCCIETGMLQTSPTQAGTFSLISDGSDGETQFTVDDIKIENSLNEYEHIRYEPSARIDGHITPNPLSIEKRKRGRPPKLPNMKNVHRSNTKIKPKGKRGRPRKVDTISAENHTRELEIPPQCSFITTTNNSNAPAKKRTRGRPRKVQNNDENSVRKEISVLTVPDCDIVSANECSQGENVVSNTIPNLNETEKVANKKRKIISLMKKRKPVQQHKALMRNYIATSVHCMKFFKK